MTKIEFKTETMDASTVGRLWGLQASLPVPLVVRGRRLPKRRRDSRGCLRPMVRDRRLLTMTGVTMSGGVDQPMRVVAECVPRRRRREVRLLAKSSQYGRDELLIRQQHPDWPGWGPGIVDRVMPATGGMTGKTAFVRVAADLVARTQFSTATGSDLDDIGEMLGLPRRDT